MRERPKMTLAKGIKKIKARFDIFLLCDYLTQ